MAAGISGVLVFQLAPGPVKADTRTAPLRAGMAAAQFPAVKVTGTVDFRTRSADRGRWSSCLRLDGDSGQGESSAARGRTEPTWGGTSNGVEVKVNSGGKTSAGLPAGLRLDLVNPGAGTVSAIEPAAFSMEESQAPSPSQSAAPEPGITGTPNTPAALRVQLARLRW
ncbi:hypothetical protein ACFW6N_32305 [Streptomyces cyaneofuscatus]|uniref:hypothetical protein n=1 Tax=Streptomyces cyaneofuscatus TaxID=66883 RepID=UPI00369C4839